MISYFLNLFSRTLPTFWVTALVWMTAAASMAFWALKWPAWQAVSVHVVPNVVNQNSQSIHPQTAKALGHVVDLINTETLRPSSSFKLIGVIASPSGQGSALIAIDGHAPKTYQPGQNVQDGWTLDSLTPHQAQLHSANGQMTLDLPSTER